MPSKWSSVDILPPFKDDEVQVWQIVLGDANYHTEICSSLLSTEEQIHANRRTTGRVRDHFTIGRACLRALLGNALAVDARDVVISKGLHGKPEMLSIHGHCISFNVAHSKDTILIALVRQGAVGIDVEYLDESIDVMEIALCNFTEKESAVLAAITDPDALLRTFYRFWARKEAVVKADGRGLLLSLASFDVSFESINSQATYINEASEKEGKLYFVTDIDLGQTAVAAVALESSELHINKMIFPLGALRVAGAGQ